MKILVVLAVVVLLVIAAVFYFDRGELDLAPKANSGAATDGSRPGSKQDFTTLSTLLEQDMSNIPVALEAPRIAPANAFSVRSRLEGAAAAGPAYQTVAHVCELIIYADQEHSVRQMQAQQSEQNVSGDPMASSKANQLSTGTTRAALHARAQADWDAYRQQTQAEVRRLLASLQNGRP